MAPMPAPLFDEDLPTLFQLAAILPPVTPSGNRLLDWTGRKRMSTAYFDPLVVVQALVDGRWTAGGRSTAVSGRRATMTVRSWNRCLRPCFVSSAAWRQQRPRWRCVCLMCARAWLPSTQPSLLR